MNEMSDSHLILRRRRLLAFAPALSLALASTGWTKTAAAQAGTFPNKPIRFILSAPAGGTLDALARVIGEKMGAHWKQPVIVESKPGAAGMLAAAAVAKASPDGYTVLFSLASVVQNTVLRRTTPYRMQDLEPVSLVANMPVVLAVRSDSPVKSLADLVKLAKDPMQRVSVASWGTGSTGHLICEAIGQQAGVAMTHVAYKGEAEPLSDLLGGRVTAATGSPGFYLNQMKDVRILAVGSSKRLKKIPDVPTFEEEGYSSANLAGWGGFFVPAGTPHQIVAKLSSEIQRIVAQSDVAEKIRAFEYEPVGSSSEEFKHFVAQDSAQWAAVAKKGSIVLD